MCDSGTIDRKNYGLNHDTDSISDWNKFEIVIGYENNLSQRDLKL